MSVLCPQLVSAVPKWHKNALQVQSTVKIPQNFTSVQCLSKCTVKAVFSGLMIYCLKAPKNPIMCGPSLDIMIITVLLVVAEAIRMPE